MKSLAENMWKQLKLKVDWVEEDLNIPSIHFNGRNFLEKAEYFKKYKRCKKAEYKHKCHQRAEHFDM